MKKYIREMINDLSQRKPKSAVPAKSKLPVAPVPQDLSNQDLSSDPAERVRQLDFQAQQSERRQTNS